MQTWLQLTEAVQMALPLAAGAAALSAFTAVDETEPVEPASRWGDDPAVIAMLGGMSL